MTIVPLAACVQAHEQPLHTDELEPEPMALDPPLAVPVAELAASRVPAPAPSPPPLSCATSEDVPPQRIQESFKVKFSVIESDDEEDSDVSE